MFSMIFNTSNFLLLIIVCVICYTFWAPYIRGKKTKAVVDGYVHPKEGKNCDLVWCYRLMYREQKAGKRLYCYTRKTYDTREEMRAKYPKGTEVNIKHYVQDKDSDEMGIILDDNDDRKVQWMYTLTAVLGCIGLCVGYQLLLLQMGR